MSLNKFQKAAAVGLITLGTLGSAASLFNTLTQDSPNNHHTDGASIFLIILGMGALAYNKRAGSTAPAQNPEQPQNNMNEPS